MLVLSGQVRSAGLVQLYAFVHIPHSFSQVLFGSSDVCGASPHVFECVQAAKGRYLVFTERGDHSIDAVNGSLRGVHVTAGTAQSIALWLRTGAGGHGG